MATDNKSIAPTIIPSMRYKDAPAAIQMVVQGIRF